LYNFTEAQGATIELGEFQASCIIRKRKFNGLIDTTRATCKRCLEMLGPVGGQNCPSSKHLAQLAA
jgi:hypothetical protein